MKHKNKKAIGIRLVTSFLLGFTLLTGIQEVKADSIDYNQVVSTANSTKYGVGGIDKTVYDNLVKGLKSGNVAFENGKWIVVEKPSSSDSGGKSTTETPKTQKAQYTGDQIEKAVANANKGNATTEDNAILTYASNNQLVSQDNEGKYTAVNSTPSGTWTIFAELLMHDPDTKQKWSVLGKGNVSAELPYSKISNDGNDIAKADGGTAGESGNKVGTKASAILSTFSHYNYFKTISGNSIALGAESIMSSIFRIIGGMIALIGAGFNSVMHGIAKSIGDFLVTFNPYAILWSTATTVTSENPITKAVIAMLQGLGLTKTNLEIIFSVVFLVITGIFAFNLIRSISNGISTRALLDPTRKWFYRIVPVFVLLPLFSLVSGYLVQTYTSSDWGDNGGVASHYLVNARYWSASSNLSPSGGYNGSAPYAVGGQNYVDERYAPYTELGKTTIENINTTSYAWANGVDTNSLSQDNVSYSLLMDWMANETFNVNTWASDVRISDTDGRSTKSSKATLGADDQRKQVDDDNGNYKNSQKIANANILEKYVWSVSQNPDDTQKDPLNYNPKSQVGSADGFSWSTQSLALILQSDITSKGANFYAYNIAPTGIQKSMKNLSTVKTEWKTVSMVGTTGVGQISSWVAMVAGYLSLLLINFGIVMALLRVGLFDALMSFVKSLIQTVIYGDPVEAIATFAYFVAMLLIGILSSTLGGVIYSTVSSIVTGFSSLITNEFLAGVLSGLLAGLLQLFVAYMVAIYDSKIKAPSDVYKVWQRDYELTFIGRLFNYILEQAKIMHTKLRQHLPAMVGYGFNMLNDRGYYSRVEGAKVNPFADKESRNWTRELGDNIVNRFSGKDKEDPDNDFRDPEHTGNYSTNSSNNTANALSGTENLKLGNEPQRIGGSGVSDNVEMQNTFRGIETNTNPNDFDFNDDIEDTHSGNDLKNTPTDDYKPKLSSPSSSVDVMPQRQIREDFGSAPERPNTQIQRPNRQTPQQDIRPLNNHLEDKEFEPKATQRDHNLEDTPVIRTQEHHYDISGNRDDFKDED